MKTFIFIVITLFFAGNTAFPQCRISGTIKDSLSGNPIALTQIEIDGYGKTGYSNGEGVFIFVNISPGSYRLIISKEGYSSRDIFVKTNCSADTLYADILLAPFETVTDTIDVREKYFKKKDEQTTSYSNAVYEEIRKTPGAVEDVVRYFASSPGVSIGNDIQNEIIVRGGSPAENLTLIDGVEVQNPNHYGPPGTTNGLLSYINLKLVDNVDFYSGGFPAIYGDKLSSVMDIKLREGSKEKQIRDLNISATGFGGFFEGPISSKSSYMFSVRRSYLELIKEQLNTDIIPEYWDFNLKLNYDISKTDKISVSGLFATDNAIPIKTGDYMYDTIHAKILTTGFNYTKNGLNSEYHFTAGYNWNYYNVNYNNFNLNISDNDVFVKQDFIYRFNRQFNLDVFAASHFYNSKYIVYKMGGLNSSNYYSPEVDINTDLNTFKINGGFNLVSTLLKGKLKLNTGVRFDYFAMINDRYCFSPRIGITYSLSTSNILNASAGIYYQSPEMLWVISDEHNKDLKFIRVDEIVLGFEHYISNDMKFTVEPYLKQYYNYPVSVYDPNYIYVNSGVDIYPNFLDRAVSSGNGYFTGIEFTFQRKNSGNGFYWTLSYSHTKSAFLALAGDVQPAEFDPHDQVTAIIGYKTRFGLSLSARYKYAGGRPYTPFDVSKSLDSYTGIYDKTQYNKAEMPEYSRLDFRVDYQTLIGKTQLTVYIELINVLNAVNYYDYYWSNYYREVRSNFQFPRVPILGFSYRF